jgi:hypothetical protein
MDALAHPKSVFFEQRRYKFFVCLNFFLEGISNSNFIFSVTLMNFTRLARIAVLLCCFCGPSSQFSDARAESPFNSLREGNWKGQIASQFSGSNEIVYSKSEAYLSKEIPIFTITVKYLKEKFDDEYSMRYRLFKTTKIDTFIGFGIVTSPKSSKYEMKPSDYLEHSFKSLDLNNTVSRIGIVQWTEDVDEFGRSRHTKHRDMMRFIFISPDTLIWEICVFKNDILETKIVELYHNVISERPRSLQLFFDAACKAQLS